ncbi:MAG: hypothetical protein DWQ07_07055 [Chloroflexi bacterium]|nr:MAG: hypothetical protein DWQ07_07055 [Chloroflexota bacterium]MBL1195540.1 hypothetical protein [Chloroflexota bacterium]NOH12822.1 hypothetical protein [Chloroflexota bacterium]
MKSRLVLIFGLLLVFGSACSSAETLVYTEVPQDLLAQQQQIVQEAAAATLTAQGPVEDPVVIAPTETLAQQDAVEEEPAPADNGLSPTEISPTEVVVQVNSDRPALGFEYGSSNLKATPLGSVSLASGEVQLVEFFAFW